MRLAHVGSLAMKEKEGPEDICRYVSRGRQLYKARAGYTPHNIEAFRLFLFAALNGDEEAQYAIGRCYLNGDGCDPQRVDYVCASTRG